MYQNWQADARRAPAPTLLSVSTDAFEQAFRSPAVERVDRSVEKPIAPLSGFVQPPRAGDTHRAAPMPWVNVIAML